MRYIYTSWQSACPCGSGSVTEVVTDNDRRFVKDDYDITCSCSACNTTYSFAPLDKYSPRTRPNNPMVARPIHGGDPMILVSTDTIGSQKPTS